VISHSIVVARNLRHRAERDRILAQTASSLRRDRSRWTVDEAVRFLVARGVDERQIRDDRSLKPRWISLRRCSCANCRRTARSLRCTILDDLVEGTFDDIVDVFGSTVNGAMSEIGVTGGSAC
jgi:hypothetical protein